MADRENVIRDLRYVKSFGRVSNNTQLTEIAESALELLKEQQPKMGHWLKKMASCPSAIAMGGSKISACDLCGGWGRKTFRYCPHCGAKMDGTSRTTKRKRRERKMFVNDGKIYGDYRETGKPNGEMTTREKLEFIKKAVTDLIDQTIESGMEPDIGKMGILIKELDATSGPFCINEHGEPQQLTLTVGLRFELKKAEEDNHD